MRTNELLAAPEKPPLTACDGKQDLQVRPQLLRTVNSLSPIPWWRPWRYDPLFIIQPNDRHDVSLPPPAFISVPIIACVAAGLCGCGQRPPGATRWLYCMYSGRIHRQDSGWACESFMFLVVQILPEEGPNMSLTDMDYRG
jgi:hypothetical protein